MTIKILLADDHPAIREGLRSMLDKHADLQVVGKAKSEQKASQ